MPSRRPSAIRILLGIMALAAVVVGFLVVRRPALLVLGDSITEWGSEPLDANLRASYRGSFVGRAGFRIDELLPEARAQAPSAPHLVVLNIGTNDTRQAWPIAQSAAALTEIVALFPASVCLVMVTVSETGPVEGVDVLANAKAMNEEIRRVAAGRGSPVVEWARMLADDLAAGSPRGAITFDGLHPNLIGYEILSGMYADALESCP